MGIFNAKEIFRYHGSMLSDRKRCTSFQKAISGTVKKGDVVLDLGTGTGIQALFACRAGAKKVYAIEAGKVIELAKRICAKNGWQEQIVFLSGNSTKINVPEPADVIVTETLGNFGLEEGLLNWVIDARKRLARPGAAIIPQQIELFVVPVEFPGAYQKKVRAWKKNLYGFDFSPMEGFAANHIYNLALERKMFLSPPQSFIKIDLSQIKSSNVQGEVSFTVARNGVLHGLGGWFRTVLAKGISISNEPPNKVPSWAQVFLPLEKSLALKQGQNVRVKISYRGQAGVWRWQVEGEGKKFDQSNFFGFPIGKS